VEQSKAIFAIYRNMSEVRIALNSLKRFGFQEKSLEVLRPLHDGAKDFAQIQINQLRNGALVGAILGAMTVTVFYFFAKSGISPFSIFATFSMTSGVLTALAAIVFGCLVGAGVGTLVGIGTPDPLAKRYGLYLQSGGFLLSVQGETLEQIEQARVVLEATGGQDIHSGNRESTWHTAIMENIKLTDLETENRFIENHL